MSFACYSDIKLDLDDVGCFYSFKLYPIVHVELTSTKHTPNDPQFPLVDIDCRHTEDVSPSFFRGRIGIFP